MEKRFSENQKNFRSLPRQGSACGGVFLLTSALVAISQNPSARGWCLRNPLNVRRSGSRNRTPAGRPKGKNPHFASKNRRLRKNETL